MAAPVRAAALAAVVVRLAALLAPAAAGWPVVGQVPAAAQPPAAMQLRVADVAGVDADLDLAELHVAEHQPDDPLATQRRSVLCGSRD